MLSQEAVAAAAAAATRGGPKAVTDLAETAGKLRATAQSAAVRRGTPEETERLDLIDGIILELMRLAREAADTVGDELRRAQEAS